MRESGAKKYNFPNSDCKIFMDSFVDPVIASLVSSLILGTLGSENSNDKFYIIQTASILKKKFQICLNTLFLP